jgi:hypothetical protein
MAPQAPPPTRPRPARGPGGRDPHAGLKARRLLRRRSLATCPRRSRYPSLAGFRLKWSVPSWTSPTPRERGPPSRRAGDADKASSSSRRLASAGSGNVVRVVFELGGPVDRSPRRRGQVLVVAGALLGALIGTALGLIVQDAQTSTAVAAAGPGRGAALAASPPTRHPPASRAAGSGDGNDSPGNQRAEPPGRPDKRDGNAQNDRAGGQDKPSKGKDKGK